jgi:cytidylate kinase
MCAEKRIILVLYGKSCSGKSTVAKKLAESFSCPIRSASDAVRARSKELGVSASDLPMGEHRKIDEDTRSVVQSSGGSLVVEGSFLDVLLSDVGNVCRIELTCGDDERQRRFVRRSGQNGLVERDKDDDKLRLALHGDRVAVPAELTVDTTSKAPDQIVKEIIVWLRTNGAEERG